MTHKNVFDVIAHRYKTGSTPGDRHDNFKLALCVEGGGMRGVVTTGSVAAIHHLGLTRVFDVVYGASSGAYSGACLLAGIPSAGAKIYLDYLSGHRFINYWRLLRGGVLFDIDYLNHLMAAEPLFDWRSVIGHPPLHITATDAEKGQPAILANFKTKSEFLKALQATAHVPVAKSPTYLWRKHHLVDAAIADPFCLNAALKENCTHILVLFSMPYRHRHTFGLLDQHLIAPHLEKIGRNLASAYLHHSEYSVNGLSHVWNHYDGTHISGIAPDNVRLPKQLTRSRKRLGRGLMAGAESVLEVLDYDHQKAFILNTIRNEARI